MQVNQSAMNAYSDFMANNAQNVANVNNQNFEATRTTFQSEAGNVSAVSEPTNETTNITRELTDQINIENGFDAQVRSISSEDETLGTLLDMMG